MVAAHSGTRCVLPCEFRLACLGLAAENETMITKGRVQDGVIVLEEGVTLPEGTAVIVFFDVAATQQVGPTRIEFPLVYSNHPGTLRLTGRRVTALLEEEHGFS